MEVVRNIIGAKRLRPRDLKASTLIGDDKKGMDYDSISEIRGKKHRRECKWQ